MLKESSRSEQLSICQRLACKLPTIGASCFRLRTGFLERLPPRFLLLYTSRCAALAAAPGRALQAQSAVPPAESVPSSQGAPTTRSRAPNARGLVSIYELERRE